MEESYKINTKLYSFEGILGRRDYCLNMVYISALVMLMNMPVSVYLLKNILSLDEITRYNEFFYKSPILLILVSILCAIVLGIIMLSNIHRRFTDICGKERQYLTFLSGIIILIPSLWFLFPSEVLYKMLLFSSLWLLILIFTPGSITSKLPYDYTKDFNWGAFLGTWMWGLYNKSYITLFQWALWSTPFSVLFKLFCGLKGNEWAYKGKSYDNVEELNKSQRRQTIFFVFWNFVIIPFLLMLPFILIFAYVAASGNYCQKCTVKSDTKSSIVSQVSEKNEKIDLDGIYKFTADLYFDSYKFTDDENKFFIDENEWKGYTITDKLSIIDKALKISKGYRYKENRIKHPEKCPAVNSSEEAEKIKIYSSKTNQLLAEFNNDIDYENAGLKEIFKSTMSMWKFYKVAD